MQLISKSQPIELIADPTISEQLSPLRGGIVKATLTAITRGPFLPAKLAVPDGADRDDGVATQRLLRASVVAVETTTNLPGKPSMRRCGAAAVRARVQHQENPKNACQNRRNGNDF